MEGRVSGCGGYGTLFPFVFGVIIGGPLALVGFPGGDAILIIYIYIYTYIYYTCIQA